MYSSRVSSPKQDRATSAREVIRMINVLLRVDILRVGGLVILEEKEK